MKILVLAGLLSMLLAGCTSDGLVGEEALPGITVRVVDPVNGSLTAADTVYWSYVADPVSGLKTAHGDDTTTKAALRLDAVGTRWKVSHPGLHGEVFIRARYGRPSAASIFCTVSGYAQLATQADSLPREVNLVLEKATSCT